MNNKEKIGRALTRGLLAGYGGETDFTTSIRGNFEVKSSHYEEDGIIYHDEWTGGGGQEIVKINEKELFTRVYAGGVVNEEILKELGITKKDVINNLISRIKELGDKTRLFSDCSVNDISGWNYKYEIIDNNKEIGVTTGKETITYKNQVVFVHAFVLSPIN